MAKYRKKPVVFEAVQWDATKAAWDEIMAMGDIDWKPGEMGSDCFWIKTIDGNWALITPNTYVCKGVAGEFYPCQPGILQRSSEPVEYNNIIEEAEALRKRSLELEIRIRKLMEASEFEDKQDYPNQHSEMKDNIMLAVREQENVRMRLGKLCQAADNEIFCHYK